MDRKLPLSYSLAWAAFASGIMWAIILIWPVYAGLAALALFSLCAGWRSWIAFRTWRMERQIAALYTKPQPLVPTQPRDTAGRFTSKRDAVHAMLRREMESK